MGNAGSASGEKGGEKAISREFVLKVAMHCRCDGCTRRLRSAVKNLRPAPGVLSVDQSATEATGEVRVLATADPERLLERVKKATDKRVDLVFPPPKPVKKSSGGGGSSQKKDPRLVDAAAVQALLADPQIEALIAGLQRRAPPPGHHRQYVGHGAAAALARKNNHHQHQEQPGPPPSSYYPGQPEAYAYPTPATPPPGNYWPPNAPPWPVGLDYN